MTTQTLPLDPKKVSEAEPSIKEGRSLMMLSADAVPRSIITRRSSALLVTGIEFRYGGNELPAGEEPLDDSDDPRVKLTLGRVTDKVLGITFSHPINLSDLARIIARLKSKATTLPPAKQLSYQMTATVLGWMENENFGRPSDTRLIDHFRKQKSISN